MGILAAACFVTLLGPGVADAGGRRGGAELFLPQRNSELHRRMAGEHISEHEMGPRGSDADAPSKWVETGGIKWCSGGGDWTNFGPERRAGYPLGAGIDGTCPLVPASYSIAKGVAACEKLCDTDAKCLGFTWYPKTQPGRNLTECCFRTGSTANKPKCTDAACAGSRCYEKHGAAPPPPPEPQPTGPAPKPSASQLAYQDREMGSLISFNMVNFWPQQLNADRPFSLAPPSKFTPMQLDTEQWADGLEAMGARYSLVLAKDESGFLLWPTNFSWEGRLYNYTVRESPLKPAGRDIIKEYVTSAKKRGIKTGIYYLLWGNFHLNITRTDSLDHLDCHDVHPEYEAAVLYQLEELWTNYGEYSEIWWDGGIDGCNKAFAAKVDALKTKLIGNVSAFGGDEPNAVRWIGTESGHPGCEADTGLWSSTPRNGADPLYPNMYTNDCGAADGVVWAPAECDTCIRTAAPSGPNTGSCGCWSWVPDTEKTTKSAAELQSVYLQTVGNNANMLLNMAPDRRGLVPDSDMAAYRSLGVFVNETFGAHAKLGSASKLGGSISMLTLAAKLARAPRAIVLTEDCRRPPGAVRRP
jgi:alpha-L-fucosidase